MIRTLLFMFIMVAIIVVLPMQYLRHSELLRISNQINQIERELEGRTMHEVLTNPHSMFRLLEDHPEWEEIEAVPYSKCYRHLISTTTADYIVCMAI